MFGSENYSGNNPSVVSSNLTGTTVNYIDTLTSRDTKRKLKDETKQERYVRMYLKVPLRSS